MGDTGIAMDAAGNEAQGATRACECMAYAGAGMGRCARRRVPRAIRLGGGEALAATGDFSFMQISDSHIGFKVEPDPNPAATLREALGGIAHMPTRPALLLHTGDACILSKPRNSTPPTRSLGPPDWRPTTFRASMTC